LTKGIKKLNVTREDIVRVVENNDKQRYKIDIIDEEEYIRANQGHTLNLNVEMKKVNNVRDIPSGMAVHGTYYDVFDKIMETGLSRMKRQHIHFAQGELQTEVISGMRRNVEIMVYINILKVLQAGIELFISDNGVILSPGNEQGFIPPELFDRIVDSKTGKEIHKVN